MKYYKLLTQSGYGTYEKGKIYKETDQEYDSSWAKKISDMVMINSTDWKQVTFADYAKQEGWYIKGSKEFAKWVVDNGYDLNNWHGNFPTYHYTIINGKVECVKDQFDNVRIHDQSLEVTVDQLDELLNNNDMERFQVKVTPTTSRILQELAFENGYKWADQTKKLDTSRKYLQFWNDKEFTHSDHEQDWVTVSLEEAIEQIEPKPEPIEIGGYEVTIDGNTVKVGCKTFDIGIIKALYSNMEELHINAVEVANQDIHHKTIKQIIERYDQNS